LYSRAFFHIQSVALRLKRLFCGFPRLRPNLRPSSFGRPPRSELFPLETGPVSSLCSLRDSRIVPEPELPHVCRPIGAVACLAASRSAVLPFLWLPECSFNPSERNVYQADQRHQAGSFFGTKNWLAGRAVRICTSARTTSGLISEIVSAVFEKAIRYFTGFENAETAKNLKPAPLNCTREKRLSGWPRDCQRKSPNPNPRRYKSQLAILSFYEFPFEFSCSFF
jgi:hypothetical protein